MTLEKRDTKSFLKTIRKKMFMIQVLKWKDNHCKLEKYQSKDSEIKTIQTCFQWMNY